MRLWDRLLLWWLTIKPLENLDGICPVCRVHGGHDHGRWERS